MGEAQKLKIAAKVKAEQIADSEIVEKAKNAATKTGKTVANACGFLSWELGRMFHPLSRKFREEIEKYNRRMGE